MHRVEEFQEIRRLTSKDSWRFCPGTENPADLPSRGVKANDLVSNKLWWEGPEFLQKSEDEWPKCSSEEADTALNEVVKKLPAVTHSLVTKGLGLQPKSTRHYKEYELRKFLYLDPRFSSDRIRFAVYQQCQEVN
jgi:hypothetical protein